MFHSCSFFLSVVCYFAVTSITIVFSETCGNGSIGDGKCDDRRLCCSKYGWCGSTRKHCNNKAPVTPSPPLPCGNGKVGNGKCTNPKLCCSVYGYCGSTTDHCKKKAPTSPSSPSPTPCETCGKNDETSRMVSYVGNWQTCPSAQQLAQYTHIVIAFAVSYTWSPTKDICSSTCEISTPTVCNNKPNTSLIRNLKKAGKKVLLGFGGASMGGSWDGNVNNCWDYCFGRETQVVNRLVAIAKELGTDGVDIDYEYFLANNPDRGFTKGKEAIRFLTEVTTGLRTKLPTGSLVTHAPMDSDIVVGKPYFNLLQNLSNHLSFLMPQYYNGVTRPVQDGLDGSGVGEMSALAHYKDLVNKVFGGDATKVVFGFCIKDFSGTSSNANGKQAAIIMKSLKTHYSINGGAFFWVAVDDTKGSWSKAVNAVIRS